MSFLGTLFGDKNTSYIKTLAPLVEKTNALEGTVAALDAADFPKKTAELKERYQKGETLDELLPEAFALVREAAKRTLGQRHYDVQLIGGIVLHQGKIAEMRTGEGKTLVATLPAYLNALSGKGVHVVTVNDYLSRRDAGWMGQVYDYLGLSVGIINDMETSFIYDAKHVEESTEREQEGAFKVFVEFLRPVSRKDAYAADITYGTNSQFGFDYLRDNLARTPEAIVQRGHNYAVVDEVDSILIDESRTPLIISSEAGDSEDFYRSFAGIARTLARDIDYEVDEKLKAITLTDTGITKAEAKLGVENIYTEKGIKYVHHLETAVRAQALFEKDKDYVVKDGEIIIVDPFTGRMQPGRRWNEGLHQAIEAKEGVSIKKETRAVASITYQNYFRMFEKLGGMTGTAQTSAEEFFKVYELDVITIPTHREIYRIDHTDLIFQSEKGKLRAIARRVKELQEKGQPVLIGTVSIEKNELLSAYLTNEGVKHTVLNAKNHEREGEIIAQAGKKGSVVVATNMAGRGVDIKLGGMPSTPESEEEIKSLGGLFVLGTERHEARRIDNQLRGRAGRQGDPGETIFYVSLEDDLMRVFGSDRIKSLMGKLGIPEDQPIENKLISKSLEGAQTKIEGFNFDARKHTLEYDDVMNHQRQIIYARRKAMLGSDTAAIETFINELVSGNEKAQAVFADKRAKMGDQEFFNAFKRIALHVNDILWTEQLETMDYMRNSVNLRAYGQREPLIEYKREGLRLFKELEANFREQVISLIETLRVEEAMRAVATDASAQGKLTVSVTGPNDDGNIEPKDLQEVGRNDPCPCGSGKKFKKCHGV
jgi:preprotein translocase subunit SecA